mgnify:FL=1
MQKISKKISFAKSYERWESEFGSEKHDAYISSHKYYEDVLAELLILQGGVCAYSELQLINQSNLNELKNNFNSGKLQSNALRKFRLPIDLEHFDSRLKTDFGWKWSNFFAVYNLINQKDKRNEEDKLLKKGLHVDTILKSDLESYDPIELLDYDYDLNLFLPNKELSNEDFERVKVMITCLGLNNAFVKMNRENYYNELNNRIALGENPQLYQFFTGWEIMKNKKN